MTHEHMNNRIHSHHHNKMFYYRSTNSAAFCAIQSISFIPPPIPFLNSSITANHDKGQGFQPIVKSLYPLMFLQFRISFTSHFPSPNGCCAVVKHLASNTKSTSHHHIIGEKELPPLFKLNKFYPLNTFQFNLGPKQMILKSPLGWSLAFHLLYFKEIIFDLL